MKDRIDNRGERRGRDDYGSILRFSREHNNIDYIKFDYFTVNSVGLFAVHENFDFDAVEQTADVIIKALPAIKRIFSKPVIHLKDSSEILPVEAVRIVNCKTMTHASVHSELWENKSKGGIKPRKLLTINNQDNYNIYENIAFSKAIDLILAYLRQNMRILRELMYASKNLEFNLLDRTNHLNYYLAIGKLHTGYVRNYDTYYESAERCLSKMEHIYDIISARLDNPVYKKCRGLTDNFTLKSTNILMMHRDYHKVYLLLKYFFSLNRDDGCENEAKVEDAGYFEFCEMITLFSVGHFGFTCDEEAKIDFTALDIVFKLKNISLRVNSKDFDGKRVLSLIFDGGRKYEILLVPCFDGSEELPRADADEIIPISPDADGDLTCVSISSIDSFRRIQQILLRGLVYTDTEKVYCPFCSQKLEKTVEPLNGKTVYECRACHTVIGTRVCPDEGKEYFFTDIKNFSPERNRARVLAIRDSRDYKRYLEAAMHYRNILPYDGTGFSCPHCGKVHR